MSIFQAFIPNMYVNTIHQIHPEELLKKGIQGVLTDLDNTLVRWDQPETTKEVTSWIESLQELGIQVYIISNNSFIRVKEFAEPIQIPYLHKARKPLKKGFRKALQDMKLPASKVALVGDQVLTDVLGGNRMGLYTILVDPIGEKEYFTTKINRRIEKKIVRHLFNKGLITWKR
ncbi:hypothetical protein BHU72_09140 [Desulfuribacillus stibiiarsenatis]|uniref:HAD family hydrolase n=1 Tax=Desulfuribacillus stibiiarsenatis TaxID=1390249 RepID=A0A1E5L3D6_9FIRM|nr:YqeG family HAD IIIA-type phosphatase [Desulfuribacillus stibiiarsenatis]OEH84648.1 hypothetical protein BHU72_09140 [Desulfuribacillus stibiiarsenatis]